MTGLKCARGMVFAKKINKTGNSISGLCAGQATKTRIEPCLEWLVLKN